MSDLKFKKPYWVSSSGDLPFLDFNREIVPPGRLPMFPKGAIGIRVDDDFWAVAALPYEQYLKMPVEQIVAELWPEIMDRASFNPDTSAEQQEPNNG